MKLLRNQRVSWRKGLGLLALIGVLIYAAAITAAPSDSEEQYSEQEVREDKSSSGEVEKSSDENLEDHETEEHDDEDDNDDDTSTPINHPPTADAGTVQSVRVGQSVSLDGALSNDPDGGAIASYSWSFSVIPAGSSAFLTSADTVAPSFKPDLPGTYTVQLVVSDGELSSTPATVNVVATSNASPVINTTAVTTGTVNQPYTYDVNASDADGDTLTYTLTSAPTGMTIDSSTGLIEWTPTTDGTFPVSITVTDGFGAQAIQSYKLVITAAALPLEVTATLDKASYAPGEVPVITLTLTNTSTRDIITDSYVDLEIVASNGGAIFWNIEGGVSASNVKDYNYISLSLSPGDSISWRFKGINQDYGFGWYMQLIDNKGIDAITPTDRAERKLHPGLSFNLFSGHGKDLAYPNFAMSDQAYLIGRGTYTITFRIISFTVTDRVYNIGTLLGTTEGVTFDVQ